MSKILPFPVKKNPDPHIICQKPFRLRRAEWETRTPAMVGLHQAALFEDHLEETGKLGVPISFVPSHVPLKGGPDQTIMALFRFRDQEEAMRKVYFLAGLMELATRMSHDLLRTDLIRRVFETIRGLSRELVLRWSSGQQGFLLPLPESLYPMARLARKLETAASYKELMSILEEETLVQFDLAAKHFVYYLPKALIVI